jgi:RHS repeat-associated protein
MMTKPQKYRFGFQAQLKDNEWTGTEGSHLNYKYRVHDARIGRFLSVDPLTAKYPHNSPYAFSENRVIDGVELEGLEYYDIIRGNRTNVPILTLINSDDTNGLVVYDYTDPSGKMKVCNNFVYCDFISQMEGSDVVSDYNSRNGLVNVLRVPNLRSGPGAFSTTATGEIEFSIPATNWDRENLIHIEGQGNTYSMGFSSATDAIGDWVVDDINDDGKRYDAMSIYINPDSGFSQEETINVLRDNGVGVDNMEIIWMDSPYLEENKSKDVSLEIQFYNYECENNETNNDKTE